MALVGTSSVVAGPFGKRLPVSGGSGSRTYADFLAHITAKATDGSRPWTSDVAGDVVGTKKYRTTSAAFSGIMFGTPWAQNFGVSLILGDGTVTVARIIQHGLPSAAAVTAGQEVYFEVESLASTAALNALARNGFTSSAAVAGTTNARCGLLIYWDNTAGKAQQMNPFASTGPTDYTW